MDGGGRHLKSSMTPSCEEIVSYHGNLGQAPWQVGYHGNLGQLLVNANKLMTVLLARRPAGGLLQKFLSLRVLSGVWSLMALVLVLSYKGTLTSHLAIPKLEKVPSTFSELAARPDLQVVVEYKSKIQEMMMVRP